MATARRQTVAWESRWAVPVALACFAAVALMVVGAFTNQVTGTGDAEILESTHEHLSSLAINGAMQSLAFLLLTAPLYYLFRAAGARSSRVRRQLVGLVLVAPLFLCVASALLIPARESAANQFEAGEAKSTLTQAEAHEKCSKQQGEEDAKEFAEEFEPKQGETALAACETRKIRDEEASNAISEAGLAPLASGLGIAGGLGFAFAMGYTCFWAMRVGLLTRFWGSLGMALAVASLLNLILFTLLWFIYLALVILNRVPRGRPPAWDAGEEIPWPSPGEKAAQELQPEDPSAEVITTSEAGELPAGGETNAAGDSDQGDQSPLSKNPRKRKRRA
jgi:hypothetical protein